MKLAFIRSLVVSGVSVKTGTPLATVRQDLALTDQWVQEAIRCGHLGYVVDPEPPVSAVAPPVVFAAAAVQEQHPELSTRAAKRGRGKA